MTFRPLPTLLRALVVTAVGLASLGVAPQALASSTQALSTTDAGGTTAASKTVTPVTNPITLDIQQSGVSLTATGSVSVTLVVSNNTDAALAAGDIALTTATTPFSSRQALGDFLTAANGSVATPKALSSTAVPAVAAHSTWTSLPIVLTAAQFGFPATFGAYPMSAKYGAATVSASARSSVAYNPKGAPAQLNVAVAMPITAPAGTTGLIAAAALETYTGPTGILTRQLDGVIDRQVAIGIDPMIVASIRALGSSAPASALEWLERLENSSNEKFALQYGDADPSAQAQSGYAKLLQPSSLQYALTADNFPEEPEVPENTETPENTQTPTATPGSNATDPTTATPTPQPAPETGGTPSLEQLLEFPYTLGNIVWPAEGTVVNKDLSIFAASEAARTIVSSSNTSTGARTTVDASGAVEKNPVLVSDAAASDALQKAATALTAPEFHDASAELAAELAVMATEPNAAGRTILLTLDRGWPPTSERLTSALTVLTNLTSVASVPLSAAIAIPPKAVTITDMPVPAARTTAINASKNRDAEIAQFATILDDPALLTGRRSAEQLALLSIGWLSSDDKWATEMTAFQTETVETLRSVSITTASQINMLGGEVAIPFSVRNDLDLPINIVVRAAPDNPRIKVGASPTSTVPASSRATVQVPVAAQLGNGEVNLRLQLYSPTGVAINTAVTVPVNVRADWEGYGALILAGLVAALFIYGLFRTIRRRRDERENASSGAGAAANETTADAAAAASANSTEEPATDASAPTPKDSDG